MYPNATLTTHYSTSASSTSESSTSDPFAGFILQGISSGSKDGGNATTRSTTALRETGRPLTSAASRVDSSNASQSVPSTKTAITSNPAVFYYNSTDDRDALSRAAQCWSEIMTWTTQSREWYNKKIAGHTWPITYSVTTDIQTTVYTDTYYPSRVSTYKLCDGSPRANVRPWTSTTLTTTASDEYTFTSPATPTFTPQPCTPSKEQCHLWYNQSNVEQVNQQQFDNLCGNPAHGRTPCIFGISGAVELIYFPVEIATGNGSLCAKTHSTITPPVSGNEVGVVTSLGHTFRADSAYISIHSLWAYYDDFQLTVGPTFKDYILTLASSEVSTQCNGDGIPTSMNWADLNWPVPASAYSCQARCSRGPFFERSTPAQCSTIWSDVNPLLAIPTKVKDLAPEWSTCVFKDANLGFANYWFDPPIALHPAEAAAQPTMPADPATTPAAPSSTPRIPAASSTMSPTPHSNSVESSTAFHAPPASTAEPSLPSSEDNDPINAPSKTSNGDLSTQATFEQPSTNPLEQTRPLDPAATNSAIGTSSAQQSSVGASVDQAPALSILTHALSSGSPPPVVSSDDPGTPSSVSLPVFSFDPTTASSQSGIVISLGGQVATALPTSNGFILGTHTLPIGVYTTISGTLLQAGSGALIVGSSYLGASLLDAKSPLTAAAGSLTLTASQVNPNVWAVDGQTLSGGGPVGTVSGQMITADSDGLALLAGQKTAVLSSVPSTAKQNAGAAYTFAAGTNTFTASKAQESSAYVVNGTTLSEGGHAMTVGGATITYGSSGPVLVGSQTTGTLGGVPNHTDRGNVYALGSMTVTASEVSNHPGEYVVNGTTISRGGSAMALSSGTITVGAEGLAAVTPATTERMSTLPSLPTMEVGSSSSTTGALSAGTVKPSTRTLTAETPPAETAARSAASPSICLQSRHVWMAILVTTFYLLCVT